MTRHFSPFDFRNEFSFEGNALLSFIFTYSIKIKKITETWIKVRVCSPQSKIVCNLIWILSVEKKNTKIILLFCQWKGKRCLNLDDEKNKAVDQCRFSSKCSDISVSKHASNHFYWTTQSEQSQWNFLTLMMKLQDDEIANLCSVVLQPRFFSSLISFSRSITWSRKCNSE